MKSNVAYPILVSKVENKYFIKIPDWNGVVHGVDFAETLGAAREFLGKNWTDRIEKKISIPQPNSVTYQRKEEVLTYVDIDFEEYQRKTSKEFVRRYCKLPNWLYNKAVFEYNIDLSEFLQDALEERFMNSKTKE